MSVSGRTGSGILLESGTNEVEFLECFLGKVSYGINVSKVQQVFALSSIQVTDVPDKPRGMVGVMYFRDQPVMLVDLRAALEVAPDADMPPEERRMVVVTRFNRTVTGFIIDGVSKIHRTSWDQFEPLQMDFGHAGYTVGTVRIEGRVVLVLDLERLLADFTPQREETPADPPPVDARARRATLKVLYAEDSKMTRTVTLRTLADAGFTQVTAFENGKAAWEYLAGLASAAQAQKRSLREFIDCVITDIEMPQLDGLTLCRMIKEAAGGEHIPSVVVYSSLINEEMSRKCKAVGADAQLSKPHGAQIIEVLDRLCGLGPAPG